MILLETELLILIHIIKAFVWCKSGLILFNVDDSQVQFLSLCEFSHGIFRFLMILELHVIAM
jgi:hypothetical protein